MVKKNLNPLKIDFKKCIIEDCLLQIRDEKMADEPELTNVWTIQINAKDSKLVIDLIRKKSLNEDPIPFNHIKRIRKPKASEKILEVVLCSTELISEKEECLSLLKKCGFAYQNVTCHNVVPKQGPPTKELALKWSELYWPLNWCGNPNDQILNDYTFDMGFIKARLAQITAIAKQEVEKGNMHPVVTAFVNPNNKEKPIISIDQRNEKDGFVLDHSVMTGIRKVAEETKEEEVNCKAHEDDILLSNSTYLCLDFDVFTTHEPCSMCAMALIHSRIKRCIFIKSMPRTGSLRPESGDGYCLHCNKSLNSKYEVFQYIGKEFSEIEIASDICC